MNCLRWTYASLMSAVLMLVSGRRLAGPYGRVIFPTTEDMTTRVTIDPVNPDNPHNQIQSVSLLLNTEFEFILTLTSYIIIYRQTPNSDFEPVADIANTWQVGPGKIVANQRRHIFSMGFSACTMPDFQPDMFDFIERPYQEEGFASDTRTTKREKEDRAIVFDLLSENSTAPSHWAEDVLRSKGLDDRFTYDVFDMRCPGRPLKKQLQKIEISLTRPLRANDAFPVFIHAEHYKSVANVYADILKKQNSISVEDLAKTSKYQCKRNRFKQSCQAVMIQKSSSNVGEIYEFECRNLANLDEWWQCGSGFLVPFEHGLWKKAKTTLKRSKLAPFGDIYELPCADPIYKFIDLTYFSNKLYQCSRENEVAEQFFIENPKNYVKSCEFGDLFYTTFTSMWEENIIVGSCQLEIAHLEDLADVEWPMVEVSVAWYLPGGNETIENMGHVSPLAALRDRTASIDFRVSIVRSNAEAAYYRWFYLEARLIFQNQDMAVLFRSQNYKFIDYPLEIFQ